MNFKAIRLLEIQNPSSTIHLLVSRLESTWGPRKNGDGAIRWLAQTGIQIERGVGLLPGILLKLLLVVGGGLHVVVGTLSVVGVVEGGVWLLGSSIWLRRPRRMEKGGKEGAKQP
jgi:hypothetical protein